MKYSARVVKASAGKACGSVRFRRGRQSLIMNRCEFIDMMTLAHWILRTLAKGHDAKIKLSQGEDPQGANYLASVQQSPDERLNKLRLRKRYTIINSSSSDDSDNDSGAPELKADTPQKPSTSATNGSRQGLKRTKPVNLISSDEEETHNKSADTSRFLGLKRYRLVLSDDDDDDYDDNNSSSPTTAPCRDSGTHDV